MEEKGSGCFPLNFPDKVFMKTPLPYVLVVVLFSFFGGPLLAQAQSSASQPQPKPVRLSGEATMKAKAQPLQTQGTLSSGEA
jgi:hypothetical protein